MDKKTIIEEIFKSFDKLEEYILKLEESIGENISWNDSCYITECQRKLDNVKRLINNIG